MTAAEQQVTVDTHAHTHAHTHTHTLLSVLIENMVSLSPVQVTKGLRSAAVDAGLMLTEVL